MKVLNLILPGFIAPALLLLLSGCANDEDLSGLSLGINATNAEEIARYGLDMAEVGSVSKDIAGYVDKNTLNPDMVNDTVDCALIDPQYTGTVTVTGATNPDINLTVNFNNCQAKSVTLNGSVSVVRSVVNTTKTTTVRGNLTVSASNAITTLDLGVTNLFFEKVSDTVTNPDDYNKNYTVTVDVPLLGSFSVDGAIAGVDTNVPNKPVAGSTVKMTGAGNSSVLLTSDTFTTGFMLDVDENGDGVYEISPLANGNTNIFPW